MGVSKDIRDYNAAALLLKEQLDSDGKNEINLLYSCKYKDEQSNQFIRESGIKIKSMNYIGKPEKRQLDGLVPLHRKIKESYSCYNFEPKFPATLKDFL